MEYFLQKGSVTVHVYCSVGLCLSCNESFNCAHHLELYLIFSIMYKGIELVSMACRGRSVNIRNPIFGMEQDQHTMNHHRTSYCL